MTCHVCGWEMVEGLTDLPFKVGPSSTVLVRQVPVLECSSCPSYELRDEVMAAIDRILASARTGWELEVIRFAA